MKKLLALVLVLALTLSMMFAFSSCTAAEDGGKDDSEDKASETKESEKEPEKDKKPAPIENPFLGTAWTGKVLFDNGIVTGEAPAEAVFTEDGASIQLTIDKDAYIEILTHNSLTMKYGKDYDLETEASEIGTTAEEILKLIREQLANSNNQFLYSFKYDGTTITCGGNSEGNSFTDGKLVVKGSNLLTFELTKK